MFVCHISLDVAVRNKLTVDFWGCQVVTLHSTDGYANKSSSFILKLYYRTKCQGPA